MIVLSGNFPNRTQAVTEPKAAKAKTLNLRRYSNGICPQTNFQFFAFMSARFGPYLYR
jgi:hypothetical protein